MTLLVFYDMNEPAGLQTFPALCGVETRPFRAVLAGGVRVIVVVREVEVAVHTDSDECAVRLKGDAVLAHEVELVGDGATTARGFEVLGALDRTELLEEEGASDSLFRNRRG